MYIAFSMKPQPLPCYCATLRQAARAGTAIYEEVLAESGLHVTQLTVVQALKFVPNQTTTNLADALGIDQTTATRTLALLRKSGLATHTPGSDRREKCWALTSAGEAAFQNLKPKWEAAQTAFEKRLGRTEAEALKKASYLAAANWRSGEEQYRIIPGAGTH